MKNKIVDVKEVAILYCALDLLLAEMEPNGACKVIKDGVIFKDKEFLKDKAMRMMSTDAQAIVDVLISVEDYLEIAKNYFQGALKGFKDFGNHYGSVTAYSLLFEYAKNPKYKLFKFHKNRAHKALKFLKKEAKTEDGERLRYLDEIVVNSIRFGELLYKKIKGEI